MVQDRRHPNPTAALHCGNAGSSRLMPIGKPAICCDLITS
jgi:hypothetical protein